MVIRSNANVGREINWQVGKSGCGLVTVEAVNGGSSLSADWEHKLKAKIMALHSAVKGKLISVIGDEVRIEFSSIFISPSI